MRVDGAFGQFLSGNDAVAILHFHAGTERNGVDLGFAIVLGDSDFFAVFDIADGNDAIVFGDDGLSAFWPRTILRHAADLG